MHNEVYRNESDPMGTAPSTEGLVDAHGLKRGAATASAQVQSLHKDGFTQENLAKYISLATGFSTDTLLAFHPVFTDVAVGLCSQLKEYTTVEFSGKVEKIFPFSEQNLLSQKEHYAALLTIKNWGEALFILENRFLKGATDVFFGSPAPSKQCVESKAPLTAVEEKVGHVLTQCFKRAMQEVFAQEQDKETFISVEKEGPAELIRMEDFLQHPMFCCTMAFSADEQVLRAYLVLPRRCQAYIHELIRSMLHKPFNQTDPVWAKRLRQEVNRAPIVLEAYIDQGKMTLEQLMQLRVGDVLALPRNMMQEIQLRSEGQKLYKGALGKVDDCFSVCVRESINEEEEIYGVAAL